MNIALSPKVAEKKQELEQELSRFVRVLAADASVERVIVFGSLVSGDVHEWSDIDLAVIKDTNLSFFKRLHEIRLRLQPRVGVDLLVYTPKEFRELTEKRRFVAEEILSKGKLLYERGSTALA